MQWPQPIEIWFQKNRKDDILLESPMKLSFLKKHILLKRYCALSIILLCFCQVSCQKDKYDDNQTRAEACRRDIEKAIDYFLSITSKQPT